MPIASISIINEIFNVPRTSADVSTVDDVFKIILDVRRRESVSVPIVSSVIDVNSTPKVSGRPSMKS